MKKFTRSMKTPSAILTFACLTIGNVSAALVVTPSGEPDPSNPMLAAWWDANDPASQADLQTGLWKDRSQHGRDAIANGGIQPIVEIGNGMQGVAFTQPESYFSFPEIQLLDAPGTSASIFIVNSYVTTGISGGIGFALGNLPTGRPRVFGRLGQQVLFLGNGVNQNRHIDLEFFNQTQSIAYIGFDGNNSGQITDVRSNGNDFFVPTPGGPLESDTIPYTLSTIGFPGGPNWDGEISEILIFQEKLTPAEEAQITSYLSNKYGIAIPEPSASVLTIISFLALALNRRR